LLNPQELLAGLTDAQREAAMHVDGPLLIVAGAGSGKTRVITRRVAHLISLGIPAASILAITFTNKAAGEMKHRVSQTLGRPLHDFGRLEQPWPTICTFHSLCLRILRYYAGPVGLAPGFTIYDSSDQTKVIKEALKTLDISVENFTPGTVHAAISNAKNQLQTPEQFAQAARDFFTRNVARVYTKYQALLKQNNALDFDDLLLFTANALRDHPQVLAELQDRFAYILIDEYQDTNHAQYVLAHSLALKHRNICVVGDPDQSIYAWRGADIRNILEFEKDYPDAKVVKLEQNYRSTKTILDIASKLISNNLRRRDKSLWTENAQGEKAELLLCQDEHDEAGAVMNRLRQLQEKHGVLWNQMAIFYRMNSLSRVMEEALFKNKIPYQIARGVEFYNRKEIKDVLAYLRVIANPADEVNLSRIANVPTRGLGDAAIKQAAVWATGHGVSLFEALARAGEIAGLSTRAASGATAFVQLVRRWRRMAGAEHATGAIAPSAVDANDAQTGDGPDRFAVREQVRRVPVRALMEDVVKASGYSHLLHKLDKEKEEGERASDNVNELISSAAEFDEENPDGSLVDYLAGVSLVSDVDRLKGSGGAITLMTLHAAKGLEFPVVAIIGLEEGILPHSRARDNMNDLEEERRLFFVGITRAQERLIISKAQSRMVHGRRERTITSPFLNEMPSDMIDLNDRTGVGMLGDDEDDRGYGRPEPRGPAAKFRKGQLVRHPMFGLGRIADLTGGGAHARVIIDFNEAGRKTLVLEYARLETVG
jgi:DNA helicase-2/ATP-dependent DNA helicase PcrA